MTPTSLRNDSPKPLDPGTVLPSPDAHEELCRRARALGHDDAFLALLRRPDLGRSGALRLALDTVPALELLPLPLLAEELGAALDRMRTPGRVKGAWSA